MAPVSDCLDVHRSQATHKPRRLLFLLHMFDGFYWVNPVIQCSATLGVACSKSTTVSIRKPSPDSQVTPYAQEVTRSAKVFFGLQMRSMSPKSDVIKSSLLSLCARALPSRPKCMPEQPRSARTLLYYNRHSLTHPTHPTHFQAASHPRPPLDFACQADCALP